MSGVCTPLVTGMSIITESGKGISVRLKPGERWRFKLNKAHENMLSITKGEDVCLVLTVSQFYKDFKIIEREG